MRTLLTSPEFAHSAPSSSDEVHACSIVGGFIYFSHAAGRSYFYPFDVPRVD